VERGKTAHSHNEKWEIGKRKSGCDTIVFIKRFRLFVSRRKCRKNGMTDGGGFFCFGKYILLWS